MTVSSMDCCKQMHIFRPIFSKLYELCAWCEGARQCTIWLFNKTIQKMGKVVNMTSNIPKTSVIHVNLLCIPWTKEGDTSQKFQIKMQHNSSLFRIFWQGMQNLEFSKNYSYRLIKQYASRKNLAIFSRLYLVQVVLQTLAMRIQSQWWASCLLSLLLWGVYLTK